MTIIDIIDISRPLKGASLGYPGDTPPHFTQRDAGRYLVSELHMSSHSGTHLDAPVHYLKTGPTIDEIPLTHLVGSCRVLDVSRAGSMIDASHLQGRCDGAKRILLKTAYSEITTFQEDYPSLTQDAAQYLTSSGILCIGIDSFSIEGFISDGSVHRELLGHGCIIIELIDLSRVPEGDYTLIALPLRLEGLDGAPARVILIDNKGL